jgi:hypothetical protein
MTENKWINTRTRQELGGNSMLGTPRSWVSRATGSKTNDFIHETTVHPKMITVGAVWFRPCELPDTGSLWTVYRFFDLDPDFCGRGTGENLQPVIGMGVAVASDAILDWARLFQRRGAAWTWWAWPEEVQGKLARKSTGQPLDHAELYQQFESGATPQQIARERNLLLNSVRYVWNKWQRGQPARDGRRLPVDRQAVEEDIRSGLFTMTEIGQRNKTTRATVWKIKKNAGITI